MQFKEYPSYKNSGVEWLGDVPDHWSVIPSKFYFIERKEKAENKDKQLTASQKYGIVFQEDFMAENGRVMVVMKNPEILKKVRPNDFVISMRSFQGGLELSYLEGSISSAYVMLKPNLHVVDIEYFKYLFKTPRYIQSLQSTSNLIRDGQALRFNNFSQVKLVLPPKSDQHKIVSFLNTETARIDNLIAKQEKLIELLEEQRKSIISHAVTKGLNPNAPMKDSGVEWLGEVPEHWDSASVKYLCKIDTGNKDTVDALEDGIYPFFVRSKKVETINDYAFDGEAILTAGDGAGVGKVYHYINGKFNYHQRVYKMSDFTKVSGKFFFFYFSSLFEKVALDGGAKSTVDSLRKAHFDKFIMTIPTVEEQNEIIEYLDKQTYKIDTLIDKQNQLIEKLKEYRSSIISHAVTGKIDVREFC